jgi:hypothetical protein
MAHLKLDRIAGTTASTGTGALTLDATAVDGYSRFQDVMSNGDTMHVMVVDRTTKVRQGGVYTYNAGALTLTTLLSSTTGSQINFGAGTKDLFDYAPASKAIVEDNNGDVSVTRNATLGGNLTAHGGQFTEPLGITTNSYPQIVAAAVSGNNGAAIDLISNGVNGRNYRLIAGDDGYFYIYDITANTLRIVVSSTGLVGIGKFPDSYVLDVSGGAHFTGSLQIDGGNGSTARVSLSNAITGNTYSIYAGDAANNGFNGWAVLGATESQYLLKIVGGHILPGVDNTQNLGNATFRFGTVYAGTGSINTSDENDKTNIRDLTDAETAVAVALASKVQIWQWKDSIVAKGVDAARLHGGLTAQTVRDTFIAGGLEPFRYGCVGFDALTKVESYIETVQRPKMQTVDVQEQSVEIVNGVPTLVTKTVQRSQPVGALVPVVDGNGQVVMVQTGTDAEGAPVMGPMLHFVPEMESVEETRTRTVPDLDANGEPVLRMNVRPDQLAMWIAHGVAHRLAALEAKVA